MKNLFLFVIIIASSLFSHGQVAIDQPVSINDSGNLPSADAGLDITFSDKGLLLPRVALTSTSSPSPLSAHTAGMIVYNTATDGDVIPGLYINTGSAWVSLVPSGGGFDPQPSDYGFTQSSNGIWYKIIWSWGSNTVLGISGQYSSHSAIEAGLWRLATQTEVNNLRIAGVLPTGFQGWSGDGYPGQEAGYQYYYQVNSGSVTWHQSDWGNNGYQKAIIVWR
ncbi:MAG: hypothetical protein IT223_09755 [Crocinitomicaceae bacterium]|nr:hypothetical protein [Crocinitomicaceae bacterium]